jgi:hypothetical protein
MSTRRDPRVEFGNPHENRQGAPTINRARNCPATSRSTAGWAGAFVWLFGVLADSHECF